MNGKRSLPDTDDLFAEVIESFYLETKDGLFFAVKGFEHPPDRRIAVLRYLPDATGGDRQKGAQSYRRLYHFDEQAQLLTSTYPQYLAYDPVFQTTLQSVPVSRVHKIYDPRRKFQELAKARTRTGIVEDVIAFLCLLQQESQVPASSLGVTGSLLIGLQTERSDLDVVVFGAENGHKVHQALKRMLDDQSCAELCRLDSKGIEELFAQRALDTRMNYEEFVTLEKRKVNQGCFRQRPYFVRFVREAHEMGAPYGQLRYIPQGRAVIHGTIADDREAIFTPCRYPLSDVRILEGPQLTDLNEIVSFRGRFCEQAHIAESVRASGILERIELEGGAVRHRLLLGNFPEDSMSVLSP